jgi:hypothetical protein
MRSSSDRDLRLDFFRGLALIVIFIDHVPNNPIAAWTLHNFAFCDAAEVFVLISGISTYLAYASRLERQGFNACTRAVGRRWCMIYGAHLLMLAGLWAVATLVSRHYWALDYVDFLRLRWLHDSPREALFYALTLSYLPKFLDILPLYLVLLAAAPMILALVRRDWRLALGLSGLIYLGAWLGGINLVEGREHQGWYLNPLTWQFLYTVGIIWGHLAKTSAQSMPWNWRWAAGASALVFFGALSGAFGPWFIPVNSHPWLFLWPFEKTFLAPLRILNVMALFYLVAFFIRPQARILRSWLAAPLLSCGRHSLPVYALGVVLSCLGLIAVTETAGAPIVQATVNLVGIPAMILLATALEWIRTPCNQPAPAGTSLLASRRVPV